MNTKIQTLITIIELNKEKWCTFTPKANDSKPCNGYENGVIVCNPCIFSKDSRIGDARMTLLGEHNEKQTNNIS